MEGEQRGVAGPAHLLAGRGQGLLRGRATLALLCQLSLRPLPPPALLLQRRRRLRCGLLLRLLRLLGSLLHRLQLRRQALRPALCLCLRHLCSCLRLLCRRNLAFSLLLGLHMCEGCTGRQGLYDCGSDGRLVGLPLTTWHASPCTSHGGELHRACRWWA